MSIVNVVTKSLEKQFVKPVVREFGVNTAVSFSRNGKNYTQLYDSNGKLFKFKIFDNNTGKLSKAEIKHSGNRLSFDRFDKDVSGSVETTNVIKWNNDVLLTKTGKLGDKKDTVVINGVVCKGDDVKSLEKSLERLDESLRNFEDSSTFSQNGFEPLIQDLNTPIEPPITETANNKFGVDWVDIAAVVGASMVLGGGAICLNNKNKEKQQHNKGGN